jgi:molybdate transport system substrate-binding protein
MIVKGKSRLPRGLLIAIVAASTACRSATTTEAPVELRVSAAVSLTETLQQIDAEFEQAHRVRVRLNLSGSNTLALQILEGADVDAFISADTAQMDRIAAAGRVIADSRVDLLSNALVVIVPADAPADAPRAPRDLADARVKHIAIGDPVAVPAGVYARRYLERVGVAAAVQSKLVTLPHVRAVLGAVSTAAAEAGIVYRTDAAIAKDIRVAWEVPAEEGPRILYPAAVVQGTKHADAARAYVRFLQSPVAAKIFAAAGFTPLPGAPQSH